MRKPDGTVRKFCFRLPLWSRCWWRREMRGTLTPCRWKICGRIPYRKQMSTLTPSTSSPRELMHLKPQVSSLLLQLLLLVLLKYFKVKAIKCLVERTSCWNGFHFGNKENNEKHETNSRCAFAEPLFTKWRALTSHFTLWQFLSTQKSKADGEIF